MVVDCLVGAEACTRFVPILTNAIKTVGIPTGKESHNPEVWVQTSLKARKRNLWEDLVTHTLPETNIAPENRPSQKESSLPTIHFQGLLI